MIISRAVSLFLRFAEFVCATIVLGLMAYYIHTIRSVDGSPRVREIYTLTVSVLATIASIVLLIPTTSSFMHWPIDFIFSALWFAAFGLLVHGSRNTGCGGVFSWGRIRDGGFCGRWKAIQAFAFLAAIFWFTSCLLSLWVSRRNRQEKGVTTARSGRRWGRRSAV